MTSPLSAYQELIARAEKEKQKILRKLSFVPWSRLLCFLLTLALIYLRVQTGNNGLIPLAILAFSGFLLAGWFDYKWKELIAGLDNRIALCTKEIAALRGDHSGFEPGTEFIDENHPYSLDLDIFGQGSLFQFLNRSSTIFGKRRLSELLSGAFQFRKEISLRQKAVEELAGMVDLRLQYQGTFFNRQTEDNDLTGLLRWMAADDQEGDPKFLRKKARRTKYLNIFIFIMPVITLGTIILASAGLVDYRIPVSLVIFQNIFVSGFERSSRKVHQEVSTHFKTLRKYSDAFSLIEKVQFSAPFNLSLQKRLQSGHHEPPSAVIKKLSGLLKWMDSNLNIIAWLFLNGFLLFNLHILRAVERWRSEYRALVPEWFEVLAEFDALSGLAACSFNHPSFIVPETEADGFALSARDLGHPLIHERECVTNDIEIHGWQQFLIITGANMSGKSTFLRTIGTNYILAMIGAPVFASKFTFTPIEIHSTLRNNDSLVKGESYFYAELKQLKEIVEALKSGRKILILLDEILKGTNSADKQSGSIALIRQLLEYNVIGIFATHDTELSRLVDIYPDHIRNHCFEIFFTGDQMEIDYKLRPGVCKNLNASYLMRKMGIIVT